MRQMRDHVVFENLKDFCSIVILPNLLSTRSDDTEFLLTIK